MMHALWLRVALGLLVLGPSDAGAPAADGDAIAFKDVTLVPMDRARVIDHQTVVVRDGRIAEIGAASQVRVPDSARRLDGRGKYLIPGLIDMHTHLFADEEFPDSLAGDELMIMVANGVTTVRLMVGTPEQLVLREQVATGKLAGPTLYLASPQISGRRVGRVFNGRVVTTAEEARQAVRDFQAAGYDFIKLTYAITRPVYDAVVTTANEIGIRVVGHVDTQVGVARALEARQSIEHLDAYLESVLRDDAPLKTSVSGLHIFRKENWESLDFIDDRKVREIAQATARAGIYSCPTLTFFKVTFGVGATDAEIRARPDFRFVTASTRESWFAAGKRIWASPPSLERRQRYVSVRDDLVREIHAAGGKIMAGSDAPDWFLLQGFTLHRELQNLVAAGLSPYAALEAATRTPAEFLNARDSIGTIEAGKRADLVLLEANPLSDIANTERCVGVMLRGRWLPRSQLEASLDAIAARFAKVGN